MERGNIISTKHLYLNYLYFSLLFFYSLNNSQGPKVTAALTTSLSMRAAVISGVSSCSWYCLGFSTKEGETSIFHPTAKTVPKWTIKALNPTKTECQQHKATLVCKNQNCSSIILEIHPRHQQQMYGSRDHTLGLLTFKTSFVLSTLSFLQWSTWGASPTLGPFNSIQKRI